MNQSKHRQDTRAVNKIAGDISQVRRDIAGMMPIEVGGYYLPFTQRFVNPLSATNTLGDYLVIRPTTELKLLMCGVHVATLNNSTNYWTINLINASATTMMTLNTMTGVSANVWTRISTTIVIIPITNEVEMALNLVKTGAPGVIHVLPAVYVL